MAAWIVLGSFVLVTGRRVAYSVMMGTGARDAIGSSLIYVVGLTLFDFILSTCTLTIHPHVLL